MRCHLARALGFGFRAGAMRAGSRGAADFPFDGAGAGARAWGGEVAASGLLPGVAGEAVVEGGGEVEGSVSGPKMESDASEPGSGAVRWGRVLGDCLRRSVV